MKNILGLDLGTNSIGWALISQSDDDSVAPKIKLGSRIIPMSQDVLGKFDIGVTESSTAERTGYRGVRRLRERCLQRRERLLRVLHTLNFLPMHFDRAIGWNRNDNKTYGKFLDDSEPKIAWRKGEGGKMEFVFTDSFNEMLDDFSKSQPELVADGKKVPYDWTIYYLRKKALTQPVTKEELAWILLNFNQKRGYYQLRGEEEEENELKKEEYYQLKVVKVEETDQKRGKDTWYNVILENGWIYRRSSATSLKEWEGKVHEFIVTTEYEKDGSVKLSKDGTPKRSFRAPKADDWALQKSRVEASISTTGKKVGEYIYDSILAVPSEKVRGKLVRVVERKFYKQELQQILEKQKEFIQELNDADIFEDCIRELYARNKAHQDSLRRKDIVYLLIDDLLFYQRPLKSKKSLIGECPYEHRSYVNKETGEIVNVPIKCIAKSNPYYQEFRLWEFVQNLRLYTTDINDEEVTSQYLADEEAYVRLFCYLNDRKDISQDTLLKDFFGIKKPRGKEAKMPLRWNYVEDKVYPCNETRAIILKGLKTANIPDTIIAAHDEEYRLWHLLYSVDDKNELIQALGHYAEEKNLPGTFVEAFKKLPPFKKEYGAYSEKAVKKLLSVMRMGSMWNEDDLPESINNVIDGTLDDNVKSRISRYGKALDTKSAFRGLPEWLACYAVYGRHSEASDITKWETPQSLSSFIHGFKQYSMRNPIVEQCVLETLRTVHDIWVEYGHIDEIHVELGRSMKSTSEQRQRMSQRNQENENTNMRIKQLLLELKNDATIENVRPYSPMQQDILRIYEEGALQELHSDSDDYAEIQRISHLAMPTQSELIRYKLWLEQKYRSPYTGETISLTKLFTPAYEIEHVIPQGRFFDDSLSNKVICEAEVNGKKTNMLGHEFICQCGGMKVHCPMLGRDVTVFTKGEYEQFIKEHYAGNRAKAQKLMMDDIPEEFIQRQMNDSRYISKVIKGLLSNIVREKDEVEAISKNVIPCTGGITDRLKHDWGLNDIWNKIVGPRFERMNKLTDSDAFGHWENKDGKRVFQTSMPLELQRGFSKKRIDHRHHAMDALVIALASRNIVSYLNNESARDTQRREDLRQLLCDKNRILRKPWVTFTTDAQKALEDIVVSFKHYIRVINKATNYYEHYDENGKKKFVEQTGEGMWAVRKPMHKETVFGLVNLKRKKVVSFATALKSVDMIADKNLRNALKGMMQAGMDAKKINAHFKQEKYMFAGVSVAKIEIYVFSNDDIPMVATRKALDTSFDKKRILSITDTGIQKILLAYLEYCDNDANKAFTPEGLIYLNQHISDFNNGRMHQPIVRVRVSEPKGEKYTVGQSGNKMKKYVEAQSGTNLYFAIYEDSEGKRSYQTIPLNIVAERLKQGLCPVPEKNEQDVLLKFYLSPNDLVYVPEEGETVSVDTIKYDRIYRFVDSSSTTANFIPASSTGAMYHVKKEDASKYSLGGTLVQDEYGVGSPQSKNQKSLTGEMIKAVCMKIVVDRLGNITKIIR